MSKRNNEFTIDQLVETMIQLKASQDVSNELYKEIKFQVNEMKSQLYRMECFLVLLKDRSDKDCNKLV